MELNQGVWAQFTPEFSRDRLVHYSKKKWNVASRIFVWISRDLKGKRTCLHFTPGNFPLDYDQKIIHYYSQQEQFSETLCKW